jgi:hypothetical protein
VQSAADHHVMVGSIKLIPKNEVKVHVQLTIKPIPSFFFSLGESFKNPYNFLVRINRARSASVDQLGSIQSRTNLSPFTKDFRG